MLFIPLTAFSLDVNDKLKANIKTIYDDGFIKISRGLEDGIEKGDVARLVTKSKFIGKGICSISEKKYSIWQVFRQYTPFTKLEPLMVYYRGHETVPISLRLLVENDLKIEKSDKIKKKIVKVEEVDPNGYLYSEKYGQNELVDLTKNKYFDKKGWRVKAEVSPFMYATDSKESNYSFGGSVERTGNHNFGLAVDQSAHTSENEFTGETNKTTRTRGMTHYEIKNFFAPDYSYRGFANYDNKIEQAFSPVEHHVVFGLFGVRKYFKVNHPNVTQASVGYVPSFDYLLRDQIINNSVQSNSETVFRHAFFIDATFRLYEDQVWLHESLAFMPRQEISNVSIDVNDSNFSNELRLEVKLGKYFGLNYVNELLWNKRLDITGEGSKTALRQTISFSFDASL